MFSPDGSLLAFSFSSPVEPHDVYLYDVDAETLDAPDDEPARGGRGDARRADAASLRELRRRVGAGVPVRAGGDGAVPGRRHRARRPRVAVAAVVRSELCAADAVPRLSRLRRCRAERARLERLRQALRASRRHREAARLGRGSRGAARLARSPPDDRRRASGRLRTLVRRLHGARRARAAARALGGGHRVRRHLESRDLPREHVALPASRARARVRVARARSRVPDRGVTDDAHRRDPRAALHPARPQRPARAGVRVRAHPRGARRRRAFRASCSSSRTRATRSRSSRTGSSCSRG